MHHQIEQVDARNGPVEVALALSDARSANRSLSRQSQVLPRAPGSALAELVDAPPISRLHFGHEFCEVLQPLPSQLERVLGLASQHGFAFTLVSTILSDQGIAKLCELLAMLAPGAEVVANDWGTLRLLRTSFPDLVPVAGRLLCKVIKDPRLPSRQWATLYPHGIGASGFRAMLERFGVRRVELDVPPFVAPGDLLLPDLSVSVHAPFGVATKGRTCWFGSLSAPEAGRFAAGQPCHRECLRYEADLVREKKAGSELDTVQRGNTVMYRHSPEMARAIDAAVRCGDVSRVIVQEQRT